MGINLTRRGFIALAGLIALSPAGCVTLPKQPSRARYRCEHYRSAGTATAAIITNFYNYFRRIPRVMSFGEIHVEMPSKLISTEERFVAEILPALKENGYHDCVAESIFDRADFLREIVSFNKSGILGPLLRQRYAGAPDCKGMVGLLTQAKKLGITLHAGRPAENSSQPGWIAEGIAQKTAAQIRELVGQGKRVITYNGLSHLEGEYSTILISNYIASTTSHCEVFVLIPELVQDEINAGTRISLLFKNWQSFVPKKGVNVLYFPSHPDKAAIFFPSSQRSAPYTDYCKNL